MCGRCVSGHVVRESFWGRLSAVRLGYEMHWPRGPDRVGTRRAWLFIFRRRWGKCLTSFQGSGHAKAMPSGVLHIIIKSNPQFLKKLDSSTAFGNQSARKRVRIFPFSIAITGPKSRVITQKCLKKKVILKKKEVSRCVTTPNVYTWNSLRRLASLKKNPSLHIGHFWVALGNWGEFQIWTNR